jgi:spore maturation protein CgeB
VARSTEEATAVLDLSDAEINRIGKAARERTLAEHTSERRAHQLLQIVTDARRQPIPTCEEDAA